VALTVHKSKLLIAKVGLDGHDRGVKVVARTLRDAGYEIVYTGLQQTPEQVVAAAIQEDVAGIGISILSGAHMVLIPRIITLLAAEGATDLPVFCGGIIPDADITALRDLGVVAVFTPGATMASITKWADGRFGTPAAA
jgi:methylmalonyl-CoA mutase C-terminal domain/subunit